MKGVIGVLLVCAVLSAPLQVMSQGAAPVESTLSLIPLPGKLERRAGAFTLRAITPIVVDAAVRMRGRQLAAMLGPATGFDRCGSLRHHLEWRRQHGAHEKHTNHALHG